MANGYKETWLESHNNYMKKKAKDSKMISAKDAALNPKLMFRTDCPFNMEMCFHCTIANRKFAVEDIDDDYQQIRMKLCRICRYNFNQQRLRRFHSFELPIFKREYKKKKMMKQKDQPGKKKEHRKRDEEPRKKEEEDYDSTSCFSDFSE